MAGIGSDVEPDGRRSRSRGGRCSNSSSSSISSSSNSSGLHSTGSSREEEQHNSVKDHQDNLHAGVDGAFLKATGPSRSSNDRMAADSTQRGHGGAGRGSTGGSRRSSGDSGRGENQRPIVENVPERNTSERGGASTVPISEGFSYGGNQTVGGGQDFVGHDIAEAGGEEQPLHYFDGRQEDPPARANSRGGGRRSSNGGVRGRATVPSPQHDQDGSTSSEKDDDETSVDCDSTPRGRRQDDSRSSSFTSPFNSTDGGGSVAGGGGGPKSADNGGSGGGAVAAIPGVSLRPGNVPFGASALSKTLSNHGRGRPRGLRPRTSGSGTPFGSTSSGRVTVAAMASSGSRSGSAGVGSSASSNVRQGIAEVAELVAPGVHVEEVVRAAVKIESVMRVLIARAYVRRKLVSEVTAFSLIMERGIEVIKHPFSGKAKPKNVTVNFVLRKGTTQLSWGGKSGVPLETIFGVTKGIKTEALSRVVGPDRAENCFSLLTPDRTIDFEVDNPWLVLLVVRAMRLFLGAHYDTLPAPTFFSHLCVRPRGAARTDNPKQTLVWTGEAEKGPRKELASTPTERTSGASMDSDSDEAGAGGSRSGGRSPWARIEEARCSGAEAGDDATYPVASRACGDEDGATPPPPPEHQAARNGPSPSRSSGGGVKDGRDEDLGNIYGENEGGATEDSDHQRSPGGIMSLFAGGRRSGEYQIDLGRTGDSTESGAGGGEDSLPGEEQPLTASQVLATRGATKRLNLSKKLSGPKETGAALKGKRFNLMALPADSSGQQDRRERGLSLDLENMPKRTQGMSISIGAGYNLPEEQDRTGGGGPHDPERIAIVDDLNDKLQSLRKLCVPQRRIGAYRPGSKQPKTMAVKHMAFFKDAGGSVVGGMGSIADMWGDGVRRQYQTDIVRQKNESVEDVRKRDDVRTAMLVNRSGVHRVTRKAGASSDPR